MLDQWRKERGYLYVVNINIVSRSLFDWFLVDWTDNARDILNFFNFYLPSKVSASPLPTHLVRVPKEESVHRQNNSFRHRTLIAVGHSYGGCTSYVCRCSRYSHLINALVQNSGCFDTTETILFYHSRRSGDYQAYRKFSS